MMANLAAITQICRALAESDSSIVPVSPVHAFSYLDDSKHREIALGYCLALLGTCDEIWMYGDWQQSEGCKLEMKMAENFGMDIVYMVE